MNESDPRSDVYYLGIHTITYYLLNIFIYLFILYLFITYYLLTSVNHSFQITKSNKHANDGI